MFITDPCLDVGFSSTEVAFLEIWLPGSLCDGVHWRISERNIELAFAWMISPASWNCQLPGRTKTTIDCLAPKSFECHGLPLSISEDICGASQGSGISQGVSMT